MSDTPTLYIVPTPIGNLADITQRALDILRSVDLVAAEDTRHSGILLSHYQISVPTFALHDHNEQQKADVLIDRIKEGKSIALVSDAGTPLISDPGYHLVTRCREAGVKVVPLPGPCAAITALSAAGLPTDRFAFEGFLPAKAKGRDDRQAQPGWPIELKRRTDAGAAKTPATGECRSARRAASSPATGPAVARGSRSSAPTGRRALRASTARC